MQVGQGVKLCPRCSVRKQLRDFGRCESRRDGLATYCRECYRLIHREHYRRRHARRRAAISQRNRRQHDENARTLLAYLRTHPCVDCGERDPVVLEFDHVRGVKRRAVERLASSGCSVGTLLAEIEKCEVRCANCHRRKTARERGYRRVRFDDGMHGMVREPAPVYRRHLSVPLRRRTPLRHAATGR